MNFTTKIPLEKSNNPINYDSKIVSLGSCFAENMAEKFEYFKFQNVVNPFGIIFNVVSIEKLILRSIHKHYFTEKDIFFHNELWHCYEVHSELSNQNAAAFLNDLNTILESINNQITQSTHVIITLGTSWVYKNVVTNEIVANCHKVSQKHFTKELLSVETNQQSLENIISSITSINNEIKFIFTVSPVRHIKDGFVENTISKSHLIAAVHKTINHQSQIANYFPSFEIMMDELRDYRFYTEDMLHPNQIAINYIWERFLESQISEEAYSIINKVDSIQKSLKHKPFNPNSESHQQFLATLQKKIAKLVIEYPYIKI